MKFDGGAARADGMPALGLTDHNLLTGVIEFATACKAAGIQVIIGLEINLNDGPVNLLATGLEGWSCLCQQFGKANSIARSGGNSVRFFMERFYYCASRVSVGVTIRIKRN